MAEGSLARKCSPSPTPTTSGLPSFAPTIRPGRPRADDGEAIGPFEPRQGPLDGGEQVVAVGQLAGDQVGDDLGVGLGPEGDASALQLLRSAAWFSITPLWTTATASPFAADVGWAFRSVAGPWVAHRVWPIPHGPARVVLRAILPGTRTRPARLRTSIRPVERRDAGAVVAAIFEPAEAREQDRGSRRAAPV